GAVALTRERAGLPIDAYFSASMLAWILRNVPEADALARAGKLQLGTTDAFFLQHLTGRCATDITTASRTSLMNLERGAWDEELCKLFEVPIEALPPIRSTVDSFGTVQVNGRDTPVTASVVDQQAALYGHGCRSAGDAKITFGTGAFVLALTGNGAVRSAAEGFLPTGAWRIGAEAPHYAVDGGVYNASSAVDWARSLGLFESYDEIGRFDGPPAIARDLAFVPALSGLACPLWDRAAAGLWLGLSLDTSRHDLVRAVLEGVALRAAEVVAAMARHIAVQDRVSIDGGMAKNLYFCQFLADALGRQVTVPAVSEITALGCAMLAAGGNLDLGPAAAAASYVPQAADRRAWADRFAEAVARAKSWRRTG
ncbi:MAG TPA: FGGY-family carbohydrate kinase, partial [Hyphomicrobiales bacterium]|nr:FGGY-family carbohydrate kinase [Hyphomicrobiales bacterium]